MHSDYVDFHAHLDLYPDLAKAIGVCDSAKVATLAVTTTPKAFERNVQLSSKSDFVQVALGMHPQLVADRHAEIDLFESLLDRTRYVGEIGLDRGPAHYRSFDLQREIFSRILRACEAQGDKVLSLHSVRAAKPVLDMLDEYLPPDRARIVLHWFTGSRSDTRRAIARGCYFSINEAMLSSESGKRVLREIPSDRLLTETDGPFVLRNGKPVRPGDVGRAVELCADLLGFSVEETKRQILSNLETMLQNG